MRTLLISPDEDRDFEAMASAGQTLGWSVQRPSPGPLSDEWVASLAEAEVALYGQTEFCCRRARELRRVLLDPPMDMLAELPSDLLHRWCRCMPSAEAAACTERAFYKCADEKYFTAGVYDGFAALPAHHTIPPGEPILIVEPVQWEMEFRCFALDGKVQSASLYTVDLSLDVLDEARAGLSTAVAFAESILSHAAVKLPPACVVDVGRIHSRDWALIEFNAPYSSGLYATDPRAVLPVVARTLVSEAAGARVDPAWLVADRRLDGIEYSRRGGAVVGQSRGH